MPTHRDAISQLFGAAPIILHAGGFGWVQRARWYWVHGMDLSKRRNGSCYEFFPRGSSSIMRLSSGIQVRANQEHGDLNEDGHGTAAKGPM